MTDALPPQNIYDDPGFFAGYSRLERFGAGWTRAFEHPQFLSLLPEVEGKRVLDLGCGAGQWSHHLAERGAAEVIGVDISDQMLALARAEWSHPKLTYLRASIEEVEFPLGRFDLVVGSLAFHYVADYAGLCRRIAAWLVPGGSLVFSTEHPIYLTRATAEGWVRDEAGQIQAWGISRYGDEGLREEHWFAEGVRKYYRTLATLLNGLIEAGLTIERVLEPLPDEEMLRRRPDWHNEIHHPTFLLVRARKA